MLQALTRNGILLSKPGFGYGLAREPRLISADDTLRALPERDQLTIGPEGGSMIERRVVIPGLRSAEQALSEALQRLTVQSLVRSAIR